MVTMNAPDLRAVVLLLGAIGVLTSVVLLHLRFKEADFLRLTAGWWGAGPLAFFFGTLLMGARGLLHPVPSVVFGNAFIIGGAACMYLGTRLFFRLPPVRWPWVLLGLTSVVLFLWVAIWPDYRWRLMLVPGLMALIQLAHLFVVWRHDHSSFAARFLLAMLAFSALALLLRSTTAFLERPDADLFTPTLWQNIYLASYAFSLLGEGIGLVLLGHERLHQHIRELATHDGLTGALTRTALWEAGTHEVLRQRRSNQPLAVLMLDLDHFKRINDTYGHQTGDRVLADFAQRVRRTLRATDRFGRYGGEEFIVLLPDTANEDAHAIAERIRTAAPGQDLPPYTVSIGIAVLMATDGEPAPDAALEATIGQADRALYQAKSEGRNRTVAAREQGSGNGATGMYPDSS